MQLYLYSIVSLLSFIGRGFYRAENKLKVLVLLSFPLLFTPVPVAMTPTKDRPGARLRKSLAEAIYGLHTNHEIPEGHHRRSLENTEILQSRFFESSLDFISIHSRPASQFFMLYYIGFVVYLRVKDVR